MTTSPDLYTEFKNLEETTRRAGQLAISHIAPLTEAEALETNLRLISLNDSIAVFWSEELGRPAFFMSEGECDDDDDECTTQIQINQFPGDLLPELEYYSSTLKALIDLTKSEKLQEYADLLVQTKNTKEAYCKDQWDLRDRQEYDRLRQKYQTPD
jgi:hypothetical protein